MVPVFYCILILFLKSVFSYHIGNATVEVEIALNKRNLNRRLIFLNFLLKNIVTIQSVEKHLLKRS